MWTRYALLWLPHDKPPQDQSPSAESNTTARRLFILTLYLVLALSQEWKSQTTRTGASRATQNMFFSKATRCLQLEVMTIPSFSRVQALLLLARVYQHEGFSNRCWVVTGLAIRMAQAIGLDRTRDTGSQAQREQRSRVWWCCVLLDR